MNFELSEEHIMIRDAARDFARKELLPGVIERDEKQEFPGGEHQGDFDQPRRQRRHRANRHHRADARADGRHRDRAAGLTLLGEGIAIERGRRRCRRARHVE